MIHTPHKRLDSREGGRNHMKPTMIIHMEPPVLLFMVRNHISLKNNELIGRMEERSMVGHNQENVSLREVRE